MNTKRYDALDGLRVLSMLGILVMHVLENLSYKGDIPIAQMLFGSLGSLTYLFLMISAFSISCGYFEKISAGNFDTVEKFYSKRFKKIFPFFALLTVVDVLISPSKGSLFEGFANFTLVFGLIPNESITVIGVGWTLGMIFLFYLFFPFFVYLMKNKKRFWIAFFCSLVYSMVCADYFGLGKKDFLYCSCYFFAGCGIYLYKDKIEKMFQRVPTILAILILSLIYFLFADHSKILRIILFSLILIYGIVVSSKKTILKDKIMKQLSAISLEIYLSHMIIFRVAEKIGLISLFSNKYISYLLVCVFVFIGTIILGKGFQYGNIHLQKIKRKKQLVK